MQNNLGLFLTEKKNVLRERWRSAIDNFTSRVGQFHPDSPVFGEILKLMTELVSVVEESGTTEQVVDTALSPIISHLKNLQSQNQLTSLEVFFVLSLMRNILKNLVEEQSRGQVGESIQMESLSQVSSLMNRLGLIFFESAMRIKEETGFHQDVMAIEYALLYERTRQIAITDRLTGLYNFGYFVERLKEERMRAERYHRLLSLIIMDIDHFKSYNDNNGHPAGNVVLKAIGEILKSEAREVDIVARYGGEEMVIALPETGRKRATELADRIRSKIAETHFEGGEKQPLGRLTLSAGVATLPVDAANEDDLIKKADISLYQAKTQGRNRVVAFDPPVKVPITYRPYHELNKVALVGNFNNWDKDVDLMMKQEDGSFKFVIALNPGAYNYKFVLNDVEWIADPACPERLHDTMGGDNSVLRVSA